MAMNVFACANNKYVYLSPFVCVCACLFIEARVWVALFNRKTWNGSCLNSCHAISYAYAIGAHIRVVNQHSVRMSMRFVICWRWKYVFSLFLRLRLLLLVSCACCFRYESLMAFRLRCKTFNSQTEPNQAYTKGEMKILLASVDKFQYCKRVNEWKNVLYVHVCVCVLFPLNHTTCAIIALRNHIIIIIIIAHNVRMY